MTRLRPSRPARWVAGLWLALLSNVTVVLADPAAVDAGKRLYRDGVLPTGKPLQARVEHDVQLSGARAACASCHRDSGFGSSEGNRVVPPITAPSLFQDRQVPNQNFLGLQTNAKSPYARTAYDDATLRRALQDGLNPAGQPLNPLMPRYALTDAEFAPLRDYLHRLAAEPPPGVSETEMHFATIVTAGVSDRQRQALLGVMETFFRDKNAETRNDTQRRNQRIVMGHGRIFRAYHKWRLHTWNLQGEAATWPEQIERYYRQQPVYAVLGGVGHGSWQVVQASCERLELPCLFPNTDSPVSPEAGRYSLFFTGGLAQEAEVVAAFLARQPARAPQHIVQVYRQQDSGTQAAGVLRHALEARSDIAIQDRVLTETNADSAEYWDALRKDKPDLLILWLRDADLETFVAHGGTGPGPIIVSDSLVEDLAQAVPEAWRAQARVVMLRELPALWQGRRVRATAWLAAHQLAITDESIQSNTQLLLSLTTRAITHMRENISREYLIERIEHLVQTSSWPSIYPRLSLGPGQRVASLGGYVVSLQHDGTLPGKGEWIVPGNAAP